MLQGIALEHSAVVFGGNGYSEDWHQEAEKRGLPNLRNTLDALPALTDPANIAVLGKYDVLSEREVQSRYDIYLERYCLDVNTEAHACAGDRQDQNPARRADLSDAAFHPGPQPQIAGERAILTALLDERDDSHFRAGDRHREFAGT